MLQESPGGWDELLRQAQAGQVQAREALCQELAVRLRQLAKHRLWGWSRQDQEDVVQDCLYTFLQKLDSVHSNPQAYACEILRHKIGNILQRRRPGTVTLSADAADNPDRSPALPAQYPEDSDGFLSGIELRETVRMVADALESLPDFCRNLFLGLLQERSLQELWSYFRGREPELQRSAFDKRVFDCRRRLRLLVGDIR